MIAGKPNSDAVDYGLADAAPGHAVLVGNARRNDAAEQQSDLIGPCKGVIAKKKKGQSEQNN